MTLLDIRQRASNRINRLRRVQRLIESDLFEFVWGASTPQQKKEVDGWIYLGDLTRIEKWLIQGKAKDLEMMSLRQLRERASSVGIQYYARLSKSELIWEITNAESGHDSEDSGNQDRDGAIGLEMGQGLEEELRGQVRHTRIDERQGTPGGPPPPESHPVRQLG